MSLELLGAVEVGRGGHGGGHGHGGRFHELLGAIEIRQPLAEVVPIGTEADRLEAEEAALAKAYREVQSRRFVSPSMIIGAAVGGALLGPIGAVIGGLIGYALKEPDDPEVMWREVIESDAAQKSPTLMRARRAAVARDLAQAEMWAQQQEHATDDDRYCAALYALGGVAPFDDVMKKSGLSEEQAIAARHRLMTSGRVHHMEEPQPEQTTQVKSPFTVIDGGKGKSEET